MNSFQLAQLNLAALRRFAFESEHTFAFKDTFPQPRLDERQGAS